MMAVDFLVSTGRVLGVMAGCVVALGLLAKSPAGRVARWVYKQLAGEPIGEWFRAQVRHAASDVVDEKLLKRNGGTTLPDMNSRLVALTAAVDSNHEENNANHLANTVRLDRIEAMRSTP